jgi:hypothetical protein
LHIFPASSRQVRLRSRTIRRVSSDLAGTAPEQVEQALEGCEVFVAMDEERTARGAHILARAEVDVLE